MPGPTVGIVGGGQLARMTYQAAIALDVRVRVLAASASDSAAQACPDVVIGPIDETLCQFAAACDVVTFDHELVDPESLAAAARAGHRLHPSPGALRFAQDKAYQRAAFADSGLPIPASEVVEDAEELAQFAVRVGWPMVLKRPQGGYDGRGVETVRAAADVEAAWARLGAGPLLAEERVSLRAELAVLIARRPLGEAVVYPLVETVQRAGICTELAVPARVPEEVAAEAREVGLAAAEAVGAVGVLAVELFWDGARVLVNEVATRPHNSGHWSIEGAVTSQFSNHLRGVLDWPLGTADLTAPAVATVNVLGPVDGSDPRHRRADALTVPGVTVHLYGKAARPGRKLGHVTALGTEPDDTRARARRSAEALRGAPLDD